MDVLSTMTFYVKPMGDHILEALRRFSSDQNGVWTKLVCGRVCGCRSKGKGKGKGKGKHYT